MANHLREQLPCHVLLLCLAAAGALGMLEHPAYLAVLALIAGVGHIALFYRLKTLTDERDMYSRDLTKITASLPTPEELWSNQ